MVERFWPSIDRAGIDGDWATMTGDKSGGFVRHSDYATLEAQLAEKKAENERWQRNMRDAYEAFSAMRNDLNELFPIQSAEADLADGPEWSVSCAAIVKAAAEALSRTGAVKVMESSVTLAGIGKYHLENWTDDDFRKHTPAVRAALSDAIARLSTLEPAAPEGEQEPVASRRWDKTYPGGQWLYFTGSNQDGQKLFTRPSESSTSGGQAVTEAMVDKVLDAAGDYMDKQYGNTALHHPTDRARIKAAMEAGG